MTLVTRFQTGFTVDDSDLVPGDIFRKPDNSLWEVKPDGTQQALGSGGSSAAVGASLSLLADTPYDGWGDPVAWDVIDFDTDGFWHPTTSSLRVPTGKAGMYSVCGIVYTSVPVGLTEMDGVANAGDNVRNDFQLRIDRDGLTIFGSFSFVTPLQDADDVYPQLSPSGTYAGDLPNILGGLGNSYVAILRLSDLPT